MCVCVQDELMFFSFTVPFIVPTQHQIKTILLVLLGLYSTFHTTLDQRYITIRPSDCTFYKTFEYIILLALLLQPTPAFFTVPSTSYIVGQIPAMACYKSLNLVAKTADINTWDLPRAELYNPSSL